ncbi:MAG TPA: LLM class F420-dependent oxidoreductase [Jatrophihabitans sp.]|jgi:F420-dependent oxidoreductase-like protein|nr:LLM class F420-dependent oxidoreductase [Jatrophihabitans sp.]
MKLGIMVTDFSWPVPTEQLGPIVTRIAQRADEAGLDSLWTMDHFFQIRISGLPPESPMPEAYATLAFIAGRTSRIRLGTLVSSVAYRHPAVLLKAVSSLDALSSGRMILGVGAGAPWNTLPAGVSPRDVEISGLGIPFPSLAERFERLEELLQIAHQMWRGDEQPYAGKHYQLLRPLNSPNSVQQPHPPILVGGSGEKKTLRLVARYGDMCNLFDLPGAGYADDLRHKLDVLQAHCAALGRNYDEIERTTATYLDTEDGPNGPRLGRFLDHLARLAELGIDHAIVGPHQPWSEATLDALIDALPDVRAIPTRQAA